MKISVNFDNKKECREWIDAFFDETPVIITINDRHIKMMVTVFDTEMYRGEGVSFTLELAE